MGWCRRVATDYKDCLDQVRQFTQKTLKASAVTHTVGSVGRLYGASASENSIDGETFTVTCLTDITKFSVVGSGATGTQANAEVGVPYSIDECSFIIVDDGGTFTTGDQFNFTTDTVATSYAANAPIPGATNTGDGLASGIDASGASTAETWTLACTLGGGNGTATFSVTGSVSGAKAAATAGTTYSITEIGFVIVADTIDFVIGDSLTVNVHAVTADWVQDRWDTDYDGDGGYELIQHGIGAGGDEIFAGYNTKTAGGTYPYWNWLVTGLTGYIEANDMDDQPGYFPYYDVMNNNAPFLFTCIFTSRQIKVIPYVDDSYQGGSYVGFLLPHATPSQWSYPMFCGGSSDTNTEYIGNTYDRHTCYWSAHSEEASGAVLDSSVWRPITSFSPRSFGSFTKWHPTVGGEMVLYPAVPIHTTSNNIYGTLEGVYYPTPHVVGGGVLVQGSIISTPNVVALCFKDVHRASIGYIIAMDLMGDV